MRLKTIAFSALFAALLLLVSTAPVYAGEDYKLGPDSIDQPGVPRGKVTEYRFSESKIYPGTVRNYGIYLPPNFDATIEYPLIIVFDGGGLVKAGSKEGVHVPVFDNLIQKKEIPALVGLFISPGEVPPVAPGAKGRSTRSFEYDAPDDMCARFLIDEMIPLAARHAKISAKPEDRALCGTSSGGIAAFTAAWHRPDAFGKVISCIGSFVNIHGGYWFPSAIRKTERKPIRVFLQDGKNDLDNVHGNWPLAAEEMAHALKFAGYDYQFVLGDGGHSGKHGQSILPDALRWLWRKAEPLPKPTPEVPQDMALSGILIPGEEWQLVVDPGEGSGPLDAACTDELGNFYCADSGGMGILKVSPDGKSEKILPNARHIGSMCFGPDGRLYAVDRDTGKLVAFAKDGTLEVLTPELDVQALRLIVDPRGRIYFSVASTPKIMLWEKQGGLRTVDVCGTYAAYALALSPNRETLAVSDYHGTAAYAFRVEADGSLGAKLPLMPYSHYTGDRWVNGTGIVCDTRARFYCATSCGCVSGIGIDTYDPNGRPIGLILSPNGKPISNITLSGPDMNWLYAVTGKYVYRRKVNAKGFVACLPPVSSDKK